MRTRDCSWICLGIRRAKGMHTRISAWARSFIIQMLRPVRAYGPTAAIIFQRPCASNALQFRLNDALDDIEFIQPARLMCQKGFDDEDHFCALGRGVHMNHALIPPVPVNDGMEWVEFDTFGGIQGGQGVVAPVRYSFNVSTGRYEWVQTGRLFEVPEKHVGECSLARIGEDWLIAMRSENLEAQTCWFKTSDPFGALGKPAWTGPEVSVPRTMYACADGVIRLFTNEKNDRLRDPLYAFDFDPHTMQFTGKHKIFDAADEPCPLTCPREDLARLCAPQGDRQLLLFRHITAGQTGRTGQHDRRISDKDHEHAGIYKAELTYEDPLPGPWSF